VDVRNYMGDFGSDRLNDGVEFELPGEQPRNAHVVMEKSAFWRIQLLVTLLRLLIGCISAGAR